MNSENLRLKHGKWFRFDFLKFRNVQRLKTAVLSVRRPDVQMVSDWSVGGTKHHQLDGGNHSSSAKSRRHA